MRVAHGYSPPWDTSSGSHSSFFARQQTVFNVGVFLYISSRGGGKVFPLLLRPPFSVKSSTECSFIDFGGLLSPLDITRTRKLMEKMLN